MRRKTESKASWWACWLSRSSAAWDAASRPWLLDPFSWAGTQRQCVRHGPGRGRQLLTRFECVRGKQCVGGFSTTLVPKPRPGGAGCVAGTLRLPDWGPAGHWPGRLHMRLPFPSGSEASELRQAHESAVQENSPVPGPRGHRETKIRSVTISKSDGRSLVPSGSGHRAGRCASVHPHARPKEPRGA